MGRLLVLLTTLLVLVMPVTEHLCNWDHFLRGGQDVEFNLLAGLLFAAMVVLSMGGSVMQPLMMQPLTMQPAFATGSGASGSGTFGQGAGRALMRRGTLQGTSSDPSRAPSCAPGPDDPASVFISRALTPLRI
jgi:hypothetical protein